MTGVPYPPRAREHRTRSVPTEPRTDLDCREGYYPEDDVDPKDDPDVDAAVERRKALDDLARLSHQHGLYPDDDGWDEE